VDAQTFGASQEQHTLQPVLNNIKARYQRAKISDDIIADQVIITADTGFSSDANNAYLKEQNINAYIPDNQFRSRDPKFKQQKEKYGKRHQDTVKGVKAVIPASEFSFNLKNKTCRCPAGNNMWLKNESTQGAGRIQLYFEGRLTDCRQCHLKEMCMRNPSSADTREGNGRQVSKTFSVHANATDWMKKRVDSQKGKTIYAHRMSVVEPVFGNIESNKRLNRFSLRGKNKVQGQWQLYCLVHNIEKLMNYGKIA